MKKLAVLAVCLLFAGCASYSASSLTALNPDLVKEYDGAEGVAIGCKSFNHEDCKTYLDRDVLKEGYQPVQLTFHNKTDKNYVFSTDKVSLPCVAPEVVAEGVHTSTAGRAAGYTAGALVLWPLIIPAIVDGIRSYKANERLDRDFSDKASNCFVIAPKAFKTTLLFVPKEKFSPVFDVTLVEEESKVEKRVSLTAVR